MLNILHIDNGALPAFTMGGLIFSILSAKYTNIAGRKKLMYVAIAVVVLILLGFVSRKFWILSKILATPPWIFYVTAIAIGTYALLSWLNNIGKASWFNIIKPAGTSTLTCYLVPYLSYAMADITGITLPDWFTHGPMGIVNCLLFALAVIGITWLLGEVNIKLKI